MAKRAIRGVCATLASAIRVIEKDIKDEKRRVPRLKAEIAALKNQPNPDQAQIRAKEKELRDLLQRIEEDEGQLEAFKEEFKFHCR